MRDADVLLMLFVADGLHLQRLLCHVMQEFVIGLTSTKGLLWAWFCLSTFMLL